MRIFNSDGSEAKMCGNGIRCVAKYLYDEKITNKTELLIETLGGIKKLKLFLNEDKTKCLYSQVDMGIPKINKEELNIKIDDDVVKDIKIDIDNKLYTYSIVGIGNLHAVCFVDNVENLDIKKYGSLVENYGVFKNRVNVEFVQIIDKEKIKVRVWERGSGETMACGTGACAAFICGYYKKLVNNDITVLLQGGSLSIKVNKDGHIYMQGSATKIFDGTLNLKEFVENVL